MNTILATTTSISAAGGFNPMDTSSIVSTTGLMGVFLLLVVETGLLVGFFLPGDSLLFTLGLLAASHTALHVPLSGVLVVTAAGSLVGAQVGFVIGKLFGRRLLDGRRHPTLAHGAERVHQIIDRYGMARTIVLARFVPVIRTVINPIAGMLGVRTVAFVIWQSVGGLLWTFGVTMAGFWIGGRVPGIDHYLLPIVGSVGALSMIPMARELLKARRGGRNAEPTAESGTVAAKVGSS